MPVVADLEMASSYLYVLHLFAAVTVIWILTHSIVDTTYVGGTEGSRVETKEENGGNFVGQY
jgi:hypothetical protein